MNYSFENDASQDEDNDRILGGVDDPYGTVTDPKFYDDSFEGIALCVCKYLSGRSETNLPDWC
jgi:hypothetical protein